MNVDRQAYGQYPRPCHEEERSCSVSLESYAEEAVKDGRRVVRDRQSRYWIQCESAALMRVPVFDETQPAPEEVRRVLWRGGAAVATYLLPPAAGRPPNSYLYLCHRSTYRVETLSSAARRDIRRAQRSLEFGVLDGPTLLAHGWPAYSETRMRVGLSDGSAGHFADRFTRFCRNPAHHVYGAWKDGRLVAFAALALVENWVEIQGSFSTEADRGLCPNDGLVHYLLDQFLLQGGMDLVSYGLSSVQRLARGDGLHVYKKKVGFEARPVRRVFVMHPLLRPVANRASLLGMERLLRRYPDARRLRKAHGVLSELLDRR